MALRWLAAASLALTLIACQGNEDGDSDDIAGADAGAALAEPDGGGAEARDGGATESLQFMDSCEPSDNRCADGLVCFNFNSRGPFCTHECADDADCPAPSRGCNNMGVCKAP